jgi:hypothetical protein
VTYRDIWSRCNVRPRAGAPPGWTFEELSPEHQAYFLAAAALAMDLVTNRKLFSKRKDGGLVRGTRQESARYRERMAVSVRDPEPVDITESDATFTIDWKGSYRIEGAAFIYMDRKRGGLRSILGYPTQKLEHATRRG